MSKKVVFVTGSQHRHVEVQTLLAGVDVDVAQLALPRPETDKLRRIATFRAAEAYARLKVPCFVESSGLYLDDFGGYPGPSFKRAFTTLGARTFVEKFGGGAGSARVAVAYASGPGDPVVFEGRIDGLFGGVERGSNGFGWDPFFVPEGYTRTLAEMATGKFVINMRAQPYLELADLLRDRRYGGTFEAHVTVQTDSTEANVLFRTVCDQLGVKCVVIELPEGVHRHQPMTASYHRGLLTPVHEEVNEIAAAIVREGFTVTRTKIEACATNRDVPLSDEDALCLPESNYFEFHVKIVVPRGVDFAPLAASCRKHGAHLSKNNLRSDETNHERFVTLRVRRAGRTSAEARFELLLRELGKTGFTMKNRLREYTVYDSNLDLDRGWLM